MSNTGQADGQRPAQLGESVDYEQFIIKLTPQKWLKIIRDAAEAECFSHAEIALLRRMQKMSGRGMKRDKEQILQVGKILQTLAKRAEKKGLNHSITFCGHILWITCDKR